VLLSKSAESVVVLVMVSACVEGGSVGVGAGVSRSCAECAMVLASTPFVGLREALLSCCQCQRKYVRKTRKRFEVHSQENEVVEWREAQESPREHGSAPEQPQRMRALA
jgi:hypothetical protein